MSQTDKSGGKKKQDPRCTSIFDSRNEMTSTGFAQGFVALMGDLASGRLNPSVGNAICNAGGKVLKVKEMELKYGTTGAGAGKKVLALSEGGKVSKGSAAIRAAR